MAVDALPNTNASTPSSIDVNSAASKPSSSIGFLTNALTNLQSKASNGYDKHVAKKFGLGVAIIASGIVFSVFMDHLSRNNPVYIDPPIDPETEPQIIPIPECLEIIQSQLNTFSMSELYYQQDLLLDLASTDQTICNLTNKYLQIANNLQHEYSIVIKRDSFGDDPIIWNRVADFKLQLIIEFLLNSGNEIDRDTFGKLLSLITNGNEIVYSSILMNLQGFYNRNDVETFSTRDMLTIIQMLINDQLSQGRIFCIDSNMDDLQNAINDKLEYFAETAEL